jgi:hypothetical protein
MNIEIAKKAAGWWADRLFDGMPKFDNGGDGMSSMLATLLVASKPAPDASKKEAFTNELAQDIVRRMEHTDWLNFGVDYGPEPILADAAERAGCAQDLGARWPWKTDMTVRNDCISVSAGYRAESEYLWIDESAAVYRLYGKLDDQKPIEPASLETREDTNVNPRELVGKTRYTYPGAQNHYFAYGNSPEECFERIQVFVQQASQPQAV